MQQVGMPPSYGGRAGRPTRPRYRTVRETFCLTRLLSTRAIVIGTAWQRLLVAPAW